MQLSSCLEAFELWCLKTNYHKAKCSGYHCPDWLLFKTDLGNLGRVGTGALRGAEIVQHLQLCSAQYTFSSFLISVGTSESPILYNLMIKLLMGGEGEV